MDRTELRGESIYSVYIRNFTDSGDINGLIQKLSYIKGLGITILWILPHYPIGEINRKGSLGSPYSIKDYKAINPELGSIEEFKKLTQKCHEIGLKIIIDIVFNHTSCDSIILNSHPDWFLQTGEGLISKVPQWSDVFDLNFDNKDLWGYLIDVLKFWVHLGVDGFRCDVAAVVPIDFWKEAKEQLDKENSDLIWLAESVDKEFISFIRHKGYNCHSDSELYTVFHILYDYDIQCHLEEYMMGSGSYQTLIKELRNQEVVYPQDYLKLRFLENHDSKERASNILKTSYQLHNWKSFSVFQKGIPFIYNGEEIKAKKLPDLFNSDKINWEKGDKKYTQFIRSLLKIGKMDIVRQGIYTINPIIDNCFHLRYRFNGKTLHGFFNFGKKNRSIPIESLEGDYLNLIDNSIIKITDKGLKLNKAPYIFESVP